MVEAAVDRLGRPVGGAGAVDVGQHVDGSPFEGPAEVITSRRAVGTLWLLAPMSCCISSWPLFPVRFAVGGDHVLVDAPGRFDLDMLVVGEQRSQSWRCLSVSRSDPVCRVRRAA